MAKYKLTDETKVVNGVTLHRIEATEDFDNVKIGDKGGFVQSKYNLSDTSSCWISDDAQIFEHAQVSGNAMVYGKARIAGFAVVTINAQVYDKAKVLDTGYVAGNAKVFERAAICSNAIINDNVCIKGNAYIGENVVVSGNAKVYGHVTINGKCFPNRNIYDMVFITDNVEIGGEAYICSRNNNSIYIQDNVKLVGSVTVATEYGPIKLSNKTILFGNCRLTGCQHIFGDSYICNQDRFRTYKIKTNVKNIATYTAKNNGTTYKINAKVKEYSYLTYIRSTNMFCVDLIGNRYNFYGTEKQLLAVVKKHAKLDLHLYEKIINDVKTIYKLKFIN